MATTVNGKVKVLLINEPHAVGAEHLERLREIMDLTQVDRDTDDKHGEQIAQLVEEKGPFLAAVWFYNPNDKTAFPTINESTVSSLVSTGCLYVSTFGAGYNHVSIPYLASHGVTYANNPVSPGVRTADSTASMILSALRGSWGHDAEVRRGGWVRQGREWVARDARRCTLGVVGMGRIGKMVADHMAHFGMRIVYFQRRRLPPDQEGDCTYVTLDELYAQSDVITLHCPLTDETKGMIDDRAFDKMRDGVILINTSRGAVVCEPSLVRALESGKVLRAALDVYAEEPVVHPGLIANDRTLLLPHVAVVNETMYEDMQTEILDNLEEFVRTGRARTPVTEPRQEEMRWKGLGGA